MENPDRVTYFAATDSRGKKVPFGIKAEDRTKHMYVIGKTGMGKSTMLENLAIQDIRNGEGLAFIDPHGSTAEKLLEYVPKERIKDVVYFAPFDLDNPIAFNVMEDVGYDKRHLVVSGLMATFKKIWVDAWSARMEYILTNTLLALLEYPGATLLGVNRMYTDKGYRKKVVENIKDPVVKDFWIKEFATYTDRYTQEATPAIQNKIGQFTSNPLIRNIIGQPTSSFDIRDAMDNKKIIIINLSKGLVGEVNMRLLGSMLTTRMFLGAMSRADVGPMDMKKLPNFYFYVDEFQNFANETFAEILSEARKYKLNLIIAHQYVEQMEEEVRAAVFGNVGTTVAFRVGPFDAEVLETVFSPEFLKEDLVNLGFAQIYLSLMINGVGSRPFSAVTIPPIEAPAHSYKSDVVESSRKTYANKRSVIEQAILAELEEMLAAPPPDPVKPSYKKAPPASSRPAERSAPRPEQREQSQRPRTDEPKRNTTERPREREAKVQSTPPQKTAEDLRSILKTMTTSTEQGRKKVDEKNKSSLKGALSEVLKDAPKQEPKRPPQEQKHTPRDSAPKAPAPFEIPEDTLRAIFKEDV
ncbi:type IV secretion system DNA-binding domain-containing protein [Patescibacteria group bacterium]|nr:type IV secretion system DNA-binding domain-containing protein [Patescibacteria group bacterium]MBU1755012.1 type IV secretion system DNA-binding domain-containing protein [Patescibacteria group bacterium]